MRKACVVDFYTKNNNRYIFDGNTSTVIPVDDILVDSINIFENDDNLDNIKNYMYNKYKDSKLVDGALKFVVDYSTKLGGFYRDDSFEKDKRKWQKNFSVNDVETILDSGNMYQLILNVTEDCNLRCKYCYLSEEYDYTRNRTNKKMSLSTSLKAMDYFFEKLYKIKKFNPGKTCAITFYGGEPLLNFEVVKKSIEYALENCPVPVVFNMTTNGVLLKDEVADFLVEHKVNIAVSFDGTKENQNKSRVFENNKGSYDIVYSNIKNFKNKYPNYRKINLISVYDLKTDMVANDHFFEEENLPEVVFVNGVSDMNTDYYKRFKDEDLLRFQKDYAKLLDKYIECKINDKECSSYLRVFFEAALSSILYRAHSKDTKLPILPFTNTCVPGMKISVRADGIFDMCERVNSTISIGNVDNGLNLENIKKLVIKYNETVTEDCYLCPLSKICTTCFAQCCGDGEFKKPNCNLILQNFKVFLGIVYSILEENPKAFDLFDNKLEWIIYN